MSIFTRFDMLPNRRRVHFFPTWDGSLIVSSCACIFEDIHPHLRKSHAFNLDCLLNYKRCRAMQVSLSETPPKAKTMDNHIAGALDNGNSFTLKCRDVSGRYAMLTAISHRLASIVAVILRRRRDYQGTRSKWWLVRCK